MIQELKALQERFDPFVKKGYYTFIGPVDQTLFKSFILTANKHAPVVAISRSIHHILSNKEAVDRTIGLFPDGMPLRIYVVNAIESLVLLHDTIEGYCERNNIDFKP